MIVKIASERQARISAEATALREEMLTKCGEAVETFGDNVSGYALVVWDKEGNLRSAYNAAQGPVAASLVPTFVSDALNRHVAVMLAKIEVAQG